MSDSDSDQRLLYPIEERKVAFYGDEIVAVAIEEDGRRRVYAPMKAIVDYLGLDWAGQYQRIQRDPILSEEVRLIGVTPINPSGGRPDALCLPIDMLHGFLFGIQVNRVKEPLRDKVLRYQRECYRVLWEAFRPDRVEPDRTSETMIQAMRDNAMQQVRLWESVLAEQRRLRVTEELVQEHDDLIWQAFDQLNELRQRQDHLTTQFTDVTRLLPVPAAPIGPAQKAALKELVDDLVAAAQEQGIRLGQGRNDYPAVWGAFKQRFDVAKYDELSVAQFDEALAWLKAWLDRVRSS